MLGFEHYVDQVVEVCHAFLQIAFTDRMYMVNRNLINRTDRLGLPYYKLSHSHIHLCMYLVVLNKVIDRFKHDLSLSEVFDECCALVSLGMDAAVYYLMITTARVCMHKDGRTLSLTLVLPSSSGGCGTYTKEMEKSPVNVALSRTRNDPFLSRLSASSRSASGRPLGNLP